MTTSRAVTVAWITAGVASIAATWLLAMETRRAHAPNPPPPVRDARDAVTGFAGEIALANGGRLSVRVARLHSERGLQRFDADALAHHFALEAGEPFACELRYFQGPIATDASAAALNSAGSGARAAVIEVASARLVDALGIALTPLVSSNSVASAVAADAVADPLATLLAPPSVSLAPGQSICLVLWGREPDEGARLVLASVPEIALASAALRRADIDSSLARIEVARTGARASEDR